MPSQSHAVLVDLFRAAPSLALDLLAARGIAVAAAGLRLLDSTFPVPSPDYHVDLAIACDDGAGSPRLVVLVEVQLAPDPDKPHTWPLYEAAARARHRCDACVLVVAIDDAVATWARTPVRLGPSGSVFHAIVLDPSAVPHAADDANPELALLSALAHGQSEPGTIVRAITALRQEKLERVRAAAYFDLLQYHLGNAFNRALEAMMATSERRYLSDFANDYFDRGVAEGEAAGMRASLQSVIQARGLPLRETERAAIDACSDLTILALWVSRAVRAETTAEIFAD